MKRVLSIIVILLLCSNTALAYSYQDMDKLKDLISKQEEIMNEAHDKAEYARAIDDLVSERVEKERWDAAQTALQDYKKIHDELAQRWKAKEQKYPAASYIWSYFIQLGLTPEAVSAILGNIMAETGGQTLNIQWWLGGYGYYGMCQWCLMYCREVNGASLERQCEYLARTMKPNMTYFGADYSAFVNSVNIDSATVMFSKYYERCYQGSNYQRIRNARVAYGYFMDWHWDALGRSEDQNSD